MLSKKNRIFSRTNQVVRSLNDFILCAQDRVLSSVPLKTAVIGADLSDFWEPKKHSHPQTAVDCTRTDGTDCHLDPVKTAMRGHNFY